MAEFAHLHLHTQYSLLDGAIRLDELFPRLLSLGMKQVAMTDHGNLFGALQFYEKAKKNGVKPILGCETYVAPDRLEKTERKSHHLVLLARDNAGWKNLAYLNSMAYLEGFYYNPRIDKKLLRAHREGLIGMSACLGGEVAQTILRAGPGAAELVAREYEDILGKGNFFLEIQPNGLPEQEKVNAELIAMSARTGIPLVATNDCHYLDRQDAHAQEILMCVEQGRTLADEKRLHHDTDAYYLKSGSEMAMHFRDVPQALENAASIAESCNVTFDLGKTYLPRFQVPEGYDAESYLAELAQKGLEKRLQELHARGQKLDPDQYRARLALELGVIRKMGFAGYFLIVWDFIRFAKQNRIPVGPGRGSGAGSLVAYSVCITDIDPIANKLLFERFLSSERVSMPDFDIDFCMNRRDEVIEYVTAKYGKNNVGQIVTMHQMKARSCIRDVGRAMGLPVSEQNRVASLIPEPVQGKSPPIKDAIEQEPRLKALYQGEHRELLDIAMKLEGLNRHAGIHAAGVVIGEKPLWEYVPCFRPEEGVIATQFDMNDVAKVGLVKFDFLGLKTLTVIQTAVDLVNADRAARGEAPLDMAAIPLDDAGIYRMISSADVTGVFQFESSGFRDLLKKLKPDCFEDIVAAGALYRPGPIEGHMLDDFVERKHGRKKVEYAHPVLEPILRDTYGVIVYQEQVMQISSAMAGYSLGQADSFRRAIGKKKAEAMAGEKACFLAGAAAKNIDAKVAEGVFDLMEKFASYGFNRSHSAAYGLLTYQTAYLKYYYPVEFFAGLLTCGKDKTDEVVKFIAEARAQGISVLRPDINESGADFTVVPEEKIDEDTPKPGKKKAVQTKKRAAPKDQRGKAIRFGLAAVKGVGEGAVEMITLARKSGGPFLSVTDFCLRVDMRKVNRKVLEALIKAGAFDGIAAQKEVSRAKLFSAVAAAQESAAAAQKERDTGQTSLLGLFGGGTAATPPPNQDVFGEGEEWTPKQVLAFEKESLGFYISGHPLDRFGGELKRFANATTANSTERGPRAEVILGGVVGEYQERVIKNGTGKYAFFKLEDQVGTIEFHVASAKLNDYRDVLTSGEPLLITGTVDAPFGEGESARERLRFMDAKPLASIRAERSNLMEIRLNADLVTDEQITTLHKLLRQFPGPCHTRLRLEIPQRSETVLDLGDDFKVAAADELLAKLEQVFGERVAVLR